MYPNSERLNLSFVYRNKNKSVYATYVEPSINDTVLLGDPSSTGLSVSTLAGL